MLRGELTVMFILHTKTFTGKHQHDQIFHESYENTHYAHGMNIMVHQCTKEDY
jgi:hypothetical protein